jgi:adenylate cyclase
MGDGTLMEFGSVVDAVTFAVEVQKMMIERNAGVPEDQRITYRIGINIGDIIVEGDDIYGDGVNIAARLEGLADPGGICVARNVYNQVKAKVAVDFEDLGAQHVKNIPEPVPTYRVRLPSTPSRETTEPAEKPSEAGTHLDEEPGRPEDLEIDLSLPDTPSIAVLPFANMSADPEQEFFSDGITEDIITALSKISSLLVVARNSTFTYKGQAVDVKQVSREQGVRYVLEGSVRKAGNRVRVTAQLIDATTGHHLWAERYDRDLEDIFAVQDEITREIVIALDIHLSRGEQARIWSSGTKNLEAWECVRLGSEQLNRLSPESNLAAQRLFQKAIDLDPNYAVAWVMLGETYFHQADVGTGYGSEGQREPLLDSTMECAQKARELDPLCADAYTLLGLCHLSKGEHDKAVAVSEKGVALAPNHAEILASSAVTQVKSGQPERAFEWTRKAMRLSPVYPSWYLWTLGTACRLLGRSESAIRAFDETIKLSPDHLAPYVGLASTLGELGRQEEAKTPVSEILKLDPDFSTKTYVRELSYRNPADLERFEEGLRKAGLPE